MDECARDVWDRLQEDDPSLTHLQINGYHYPFGELLAIQPPSSAALDKPRITRDSLHHYHLSSSTVVQLLTATAHASSHVQSLELRFIDFDQDISDAFQTLLNMSDDNLHDGTTPTNEEATKDDGSMRGTGNGPTSTGGSGRFWKSITLTGCSGLTRNDFAALALVLVRNQCTEFQWQHNVGSETGLVSMGMAMSSCTSLQTFQMSRQDLRSDNDIQALFGRGVGQLNKLVLNFCKLQNVESLADAIAHNTSLQELDLGACYLKDDQVEPIVAALHGHPSLQVLILTLNSCQTRGAQAIGRLLQDSRCQLQSIHLGHQTRQGGLATTTTTTSSLSTTSSTLDLHPIAQALVHNRTLQKLMLGRNRLESTEVMELFRALETNRTLRSLDLSGNNLSDDCVPSMARSLQNAKGLSKLYLKDTHISSRESGQALLDMLKYHNHTLTSLDLPRSVPLLSDIQYELALNAAGRRLLNANNNMNANGTFPLGLWPHVLERTSQRCCSSGDNVEADTTSNKAEQKKKKQFYQYHAQLSLYDKDSLYFMLSNATDLVQQR